MDAGLHVDHRFVPRQNPNRNKDRRPAENFIRDWRKFRGLTLEQLEELSGVGASTLSAIERRKSGYSWESLEDIARALDCTPADLLGGPPTAPDGLFLAEVRKLDADERPRALEMLRLLRGGASRPFRIIAAPEQDQWRVGGFAAPEPARPKRPGRSGKPTR